MALVDSWIGNSLDHRYSWQMSIADSLHLSSPTPAVSSGSGTVDFSDGVGWLALCFAVFLALVSFATWLVRAKRSRKAEAALVTSNYRLLGGGTPFVYEISVHNGSPHPLRTIQIMYWDGKEWRPMLARSRETGDPVIFPGDVGVATVPAMTTDLAEFDNYYYYRYLDSKNRDWWRRIDSPKFLDWSERRQLPKLHGTL